MTPDTAALRRDHYDYDYDGHCDDCGERHPCTVRALCNAADEVERLRGVVERVAWRTARIVGAVSRDVIEPLPEGYDLEDLHAKLQTMIGIERTAHAALVADLRELAALDRPPEERFYSRMLGVIDQGSDRITEWHCPSCGGRWPR